MRAGFTASKRSNCASLAAKRQVSVRRKDGSLYAYSQCSGMFLNPEQWNGAATQQPAVSIEAPPDVITPMRRRRR